MVSSTGVYEVVILAETSVTDIEQAKRNCAYV